MDPSCSPAADYVWLSSNGHIHFSISSILIFAIGKYLCQRSEYDPQRRLNHWKLVDDLCQEWAMQVIQAYENITKH